MSIINLEANFQNLCQIVTSTDIDLIFNDILSYYVDFCITGKLKRKRKGVFETLFKTKMSQIKFFLLI